MLQSMGSRRVRHNWVTELNWLKAGEWQPRHIVVLDKHFPSASHALHWHSQLLSGPVSSWALSQLLFCAPCQADSSPTAVLPPQLEDLSLEATGICLPVSLKPGLTSPPTQPPPGPHLSCLQLVTLHSCVLLPSYPSSPLPPEPQDSEGPHV